MSNNLYTFEGVKVKNYLVLSLFYVRSNNQHLMGGSLDKVNQLQKVDHKEQRHVIQIKRLDH